jgi:hypothetical protein
MDLMDALLAAAFTTLFVLATLTAAIGLVIWLWTRILQQRRVAEQRRDAQLREWARARRFTYGDLPADLWRELQPFDLLSRARKGRWYGAGHVSGIVRGRIDDVPLLLFDCAYVGPPRPARNAREIGRGTYEHSLTVFCFERPGAALPHFVADGVMERRLKEEWQAIRHEVSSAATAKGQPAGRAASLVGRAVTGLAGRLLFMPDPPGLAFPAEPDLDGSYRIQALGDEDSVRRLLSPRLLHALRVRPGWVVEGRGDRLLLARTIAVTRQGDLSPRRMSAMSRAGMIWAVEGYLAPAEIDEWLPRARELAEEVFTAR